MNAESDPAQRTASRRRGPRPNLAGESLRLALLYAIGASLWILLSDMALEWLDIGPEHIILANTLKGWGFVAVTTLLLYGLLRRMAGMPPDAATARRLELPEDAGRRGKEGLSFGLLALGLMALTIAVIVHDFASQEASETARLKAIASLKSSQIADWLDERRADAELVHRCGLYAELMQRWRNEGDAASGAKLKGRLSQFIRDRGFSAVSLLGANGTLLWGSANAPSRPSPALMAGVRAAIAQNRVQRVGPYVGLAGHTRLDFVAPLKQDRTVVAVLHIDPTQWLWTTLETWPMPSPTAEALIFWRAGDEVLYLNAVDADKNDEPLRISSPVESSESIAARLLRGEAPAGQLLEGLDYRQVMTLGVAEPIPGSDWILLAKEDRATLYAPAFREGTWIGLAGVRAVFITGAGVFLMRQRQQLALAASIQQAQAERLRALSLLSAIADGSEDAIFAKDTEGRYLLFNRAASRFVGKPSESIIGRDDHACFPPEQASMLIESNRRVIAENRMRTQEETLDTPLGQRIFLATKGPLSDADGQTIGTFGISRDITERKREEEALARQARELAERNHELERFNEVMVGRELDMIALKQQVNALSRELGRAPPFPLVFLDEAGPPDPSDPA